VLKVPITQKWDEISNPRVNVECEELVLRNTFVNAQMGPLADFRASQGADGPRAIRWIDDDQDDKARLVTNKSEHDLIYKDQVSRIETHRGPSRLVKRIIKPFQQTLAEVTGVENIEAPQASHRHAFSEADAKRKAERLGREESHKQINTDLFYEAQRADLQVMSADEMDEDAKAVFSEDDSKPQVQGRVVSEGAPSKGAKAVGIMPKGRGEAHSDDERVLQKVQQKPVQKVEVGVKNIQGIVVA